MGLVVPMVPLLESGSQGKKEEFEMRKFMAFAVVAITMSMGLAFATGAEKSIEVEVQQKKTNGKAWDAFGGGPDLALCVKTPKGKKCYPDGTSEMEILEPQCRDSFTCTFKGVYLEAPFELTVVDVDMAANDVAGTGVCEGDECTVGLAKVTIK